MIGEKTLVSSPFTPLVCALVRVFAWSCVWMCVDESVVESASRGTLSQNFKKLSAFQKVIFLILQLKYRELPSASRLEAVPLPWLCFQILMTALRTR